MKIAFTINVKIKHFVLKIFFLTLQLKELPIPLKKQQSALIVTFCPDMKLRYY